MDAKTFVITGSSRGIGFGVADELLRRQQRVVVSGSSARSTEQACAQLLAKHPRDRLVGQACDVRDAAQVQALWDAAVARFGRVDVWINNAGVANVFAPFADVAAEDLDQVCAIDLAGVMHGCRVAMRGMRAQGGGMIYNLEGFGSGDEKTPGLTAYGAAKRAVRYLNEALALELRGTSVRIGAISPGIVVTDFLLGQRGQMSEENWQRTERIMNILGDRVETVTPFIADELLKDAPNGHQIRWLTRARAASRFLLAPFRKRNVLG